MKTVLYISGMHCASCSASIESVLSSHDDVSFANVNFAAKTALVEHAGVSTKELISLVEKAGYSASEHSPSDSINAEFPLLSLIFGIIVLVLSLGPALGFAISLNVYNALAQLVLTSIIIGLNWQIFRQGFVVVFDTRQANMDTLVALGVAAAYVYSCVIVVIGLFSVIDFSQLFFEVAGMVLVFVMLGRYFELQATKKTGNALTSLLSLTPETARVLDKKKERVVKIDNVKAGDIIKVKPGDRFALDGVIHVGSTRVDESLVSGESTPVKKSKGDVVFGGSLNKTGMVLMRVTQESSESTVARIGKLVLQAQNSKAPIQRVADRLSARFVPLVLLLSILTFFGWLFFAPLDMSNPAIFGLQAAIAVLIVACPYALGLATPTAVMVSMNKAGKQGVVFSDAASLQAAASVKTVVFDKTGTLTVGQPVVSAIKTYNDLSAQVVFRYAASLASTSTHPLSEAIVSYANKEKINFGQPRNSQEHEGLGISGKVEGRKIVIGSIDFFVQEGIGLYDVREKLSGFSTKHYTPVLVAIEGRLAALIGIADSLKDSAKEGVSLVHKMGLESVMLTGDREEIASRIGSELGIGVVRAQLSPQQKLDEITRMRKKRSVAMVGDGINDAPALAAADVGIVLSNSTAVASDAASVRILGDDVKKVSSALMIASDGMKVIRQNLFWAFGYNVVAIPVAMGVLYPFGIMLSPLVAGAVMAASSLSVVLNSLRLQ